MEPQDRARLCRIKQQVRQREQVQVGAAGLFRIGKARQMVDDPSLGPGACGGGSA